MASIGNLLTRDLRWEVLPALRKAGGQRELLFGRDGLRLAEWLVAGTAGIIKQGPHRAVYRVQLPRLDFIIKWYPRTSGKKRLRKWVQSSPARQEYDLAQAVAARNIPTVEPLALGESPGGASCLLLRTIADVQPLGHFLEWILPHVEQARQTPIRQRLAKRLGEFLAAMHDAGVTHRDLHPGNLLFRLEGDEPSFYLVDLHGVALGEPLGWRASRANLVVLNRWFMLRVSRADRLRFWHAYRRARTTMTWTDGLAPAGSKAGAKGKRGQSGLTRRAVRELEGRTLISNLRFWQAQDRRCREDGRYYRKVSSAVAAGHAVADLDTTTVSELLADPDAIFKQPGVTLLKDSPSSTVVEFDLTLNGRVRRVIYKRFAVTSWTDPLVALVRRTPALRSYVMGHGLRLRGLPTPRPLAVWHRYRAGLPHEGYLLTEKAPAAEELGAFIAGLVAKPAPERTYLLRQTIDRIARLIADLHERRLSHRDLKAANILMCERPWTLAEAEQQRRHGTTPSVSAKNDADDRSSEVYPWLIDLVGVSRQNQLSHGRRIQNLARLNASFLNQRLVTRTERLRFLRVYLHWGLRGKFGWKRWWRQIAQATAAKVQQNLRNGRELS